MRPLFFIGTTDEDHYPMSCACCGQGLETDVPNSCAYTGFDTPDIELGDTQQLCCRPKP